MPRFQGVVDSIAEWGVVLGFALLPFFFIPTPWITLTQSKVLIAFVCVVVVAVFWALARLLEGSIRVPVISVLFAGALLPLAYVLSVLVVGISSSSLFGTGVEQDTLAAACIWYGSFALSALIFSNNSSRGALALRGLFLGGYLLIFLQVTHHMFPNAFSLGGVLASKTGNSLGSWHDLAIMLGFLVFLGTALTSSSVAQGRWHSYFSAVALLSLPLLVVANFFDVWATLGVVSLLFILHALYVEHSAGFKFSLRPYRIWIVIILLALFFSIFGQAVNSALPSAIRVDSIEVRPSWQGTFVIGQQALVQPTTFLFGSGPNTFTREWGLYKPAEINTTPFWNTAFNAGFGSVPTAFITIGVVGILAWFLFFLALLWMMGKILFTAKSASHSHMQITQSLAFAALFLLAFHVMYVPGAALSILTFLFLGLLVGFAANTGVFPLRTLSIREDSVGAVRMFILLAFVIVVVVAGVGSTRVLAGEMVLNHAIAVYNASGNVARTSSLINLSLAISESDRGHRTAVEIGLLRLKELIENADPNDSAVRAQLQDTLSQTITHGLSAVSINGGDYQNWLELASLYQQLAGAKISGAYDSARTAYIRALAQNPKNPLPYLQLAQLDFLENKPNAALTDLVSAVKLKEDFAPAYYIASQIYASQKDFKNAIPTAAFAVKYAPDDPLGWYNLGTIAYAAGDYTDATSALQQALARQPQYANALYVLGLSYYQAGQSQNAIQAFRQLDKVDPGQKIVADILTNLYAGKPLSPTSVPGSSKN